MKIKAVTEADSEELLEIYAPYVKNTAVSFEYEVPSSEEFRNRIRDITRRYPYLKAVDDSGKILGYAYANTFKDRKAYDCSVETTIYIREDCHGKGIGRRLYEALEEDLISRQIRNMYACIAYTEKSDEYLTDASVRFHEKMGFTMVGEFHDCGYKFEKYYSMVWMEKLLIRKI